MAPGRVGRGAEALGTVCREVGLAVVFFRGFREGMADWLGFAPFELCMCRRDFSSDASSMLGGVVGLGWSPERRTFVCRVV